MSRSKDEIKKWRKLLRELRLEQEKVTGGRPRSKTYGKAPSFIQQRKTTRQKLRELLKGKDFYDD